MRKINAAHRYGHSQHEAGKKLITLSDGGGLRLLIQPHGTKLCRIDYRIGGRQKTLAFGIYPKITLAPGRAQRDAAKILENSGAAQNRQAGGRKVQTM
jgi:hypothetical protein